MANPMTPPRMDQEAREAERLADFRRDRHPRRQLAQWLRGLAWKIDIPLNEQHDFEECAGCDQPLDACCDEWRYVDPDECVKVHDECYDRFFGIPSRERVEAILHD